MSSLKIWKFDSEALEEAVKLSYTHDTLKSKTVFPTGTIVTTPVKSDGQFIHTVMLKKFETLDFFSGS